MTEPTVREQLEMLLSQTFNEGISCGHALTPSYHQTEARKEWLAELDIIMQKIGEIL